MSDKIDINEIPKRAMYPCPEACILLGGISNSNLYNQIAAGEIKPTKFGNRTFISQEEIDRVTSCGQEIEAIS